MAFSISKGQLISSVKRAESIQARARKVMEKAGDVVKEAVNTVEVGSAAFAFGVIDGKYGGVEIVGVPLPLVSSVALHTLAFMGVGGQLASHMHQFGNGALASYLTVMGRGAGLAWAKKAEKQVPLVAKGSGDSLSGAEMRKLDGTK